MGRILALDYGRKRTGIAVTDPLKIIANGLTTVRSHDLLNFISEYISKENVELVVIGLPKQTNNELSENERYISQFITTLKRKLPDLKIERFDERFTSVMAHQAMIDGGLKKKDRQNKELVDEISATIILQGYLESRK